MEPLLTPQEVADLLKISIKTVYKRKHLLGAVYPAGIKALRFKPEAVNAVMEGRRCMAVSISTPGETLQPPRIHDQSRGPGCYGKTSGPCSDSKKIRAESIRLGLRSPDGRIPYPGRKTQGRKDR
ncbi:MAG: helix-turn-helix domain-containing protein [Deltaproteobacteria bacterium]|nr:helix-turn-helix domain-containing protein [Deltaproteobacteria bacterium]